MPKIKIDTTGVSEDEARASGGFEQPKPGLYRFKIADLIPGFTKGDDGKPNRKRPRLEVVYQCLDSKYKGAQVWEYISLKGHEAFSDIDKKKMAQLLLACGVPKAVGVESELDTDKLKGKVVKVRVRSGKNQDGDYRGEFSSVHTDDGEDEELADDSALSEDEELLEEETEEETEEELDEETEEDPWEARQGELAQMSVPELKTIAKDLSITLAGKTKSTLVDAILEAEQAAAPEGEEEEEELLVDDEELLVDDSEYLTREQLQAQTPAEIVETAKQFDVTVKKGMKKGEVIDLILEAQAAPSGDNDPLPF